jgi:hypothetical protein
VPESEPIDMERFRSQLRNHPSVANPDLDATYAEGRIVVTGTVPSQERRRAVGEAASELARDHPVEVRVRIEHPLDTREFEREM